MNFDSELPFIKRGNRFYEPINFQQDAFYEVEVDSSFIDYVPVFSLSTFQSPSAYEIMQTIRKTTAQAMNIKLETIVQDGSILPQLFEPILNMPHEFLIDSILDPRNESNLKTAIGNALVKYSDIRDWDESGKPQIEIGIGRIHHQVLDKLLKDEIEQPLSDMLFINGQENTNTAVIYEGTIELALDPKKYIIPQVPSFDIFDFDPELLTEEGFHYELANVLNFLDKKYCVISGVTNFRTDITESYMVKHITRTFEELSPETIGSSIEPKKTLIRESGYYDCEGNSKPMLVPNKKTFH